MPKVKHYINTVLRDGDYDVKFSHIEKIRREVGRFYCCFFFVVVDKDGIPQTELELDEPMLCGLTTNWHEIGISPRANQQYIKIFKKIARYHGFNEKELLHWFPNQADIDEFSNSLDSPTIKARVKYQTKGLEGQDIKPISKVTHIWNPIRESWESTLGISRHHFKPSMPITSETTAQELVDHDLINNFSDMERIQMVFDGKLSYEKYEELKTLQENEYGKH